MSAHAAGATPLVGDLTGQNRLLQRKLNAAEHVCQHPNADGLVRADLVLAAIRSGQ